MQLPHAIPILFVCLEYITFRDDEYVDHGRTRRLIYAFSRILFVLFLIGIINTNINLTSKIIIQGIYAVSEFFALRIKRTSNDKNYDYKKSRLFFRLFGIFVVFCIGLIVFLYLSIFHQKSLGIRLLPIWTALLINLFLVVVSITKSKDKNRKFRFRNIKLVYEEDIKASSEHIWNR